MKYKLIPLVIIFSLIVIYRFWTGAHSPSTSVSESKVIGGIVPHHLLVKDIIGSFFYELPTDNIDNIIILGPNHQEIGEDNITWYPSFSDQSYTALLPFIESRYPSTRVVPILLKRSVSLSECSDLAKGLQQLSGHNLLIASVDFSHYLATSKAEKNDQLMLELISARDYDRILHLQSDYLDSPGALVTSLIYLDSHDGSGIRILDNTNSGRRGNPYAPTTSYFSMIFYAKN